MFWELASVFGTSLCRTSTRNIANAWNILGDKKESLVGTGCVLGQNGMPRRFECPGNLDSGPSLRVVIGHGLASTEIYLV
jgi:hypothetical protein